MQKIIKFLSIASAAVYLTSCGTITTSTGPLPIGPDTWRISAKDGIKGFGPSQAIALKEANQFCVSLNKNILVIGTKEIQPFSSEVTFRCLKSGDAELVRPNLQPAPNSIIKIEK